MRDIHPHKYIHPRLHRYIGYNPHSASQNNALHVTGIVTDDVTSGALRSFDPSERPETGTGRGVATFRPAPVIPGRREGPLFAKMPRRT